MISLLRGPGNGRQGRQRRYAILLLVWLIAIFVFSTDTLSGERTSGVLTPILTFLFPDISSAQADFLHLFVRKSCHVAEYFILAMLAYRTFSFNPAKQTRAKLMAAVLVLVVGLADEFHQTLTSTRTGSLKDVGYDCFGGVAALLLMPRSRNEEPGLYSHSVL